MGNFFSKWSPFKSAEDSRGKKHGANFDIQAHNRARYADKRYETLGQAEEAARIRRDAADFLGGISREQRAFYDRYVVPIEGQLSADVQAGLNPDYATIRTGARSDVAKSFGKAKESLRRRLARYGQTMTPADEESLQYQQDKSEVTASNQAADEARDGGFGRAIDFYTSGAGIPRTAASGAAAGGLGLSNYHDYLSMIGANEINQDIERDMAGSSMISGLFKGGGFFADGGLVRAGGRPGMTIQLRNEYSRYRTDELNNPKDWPTWLKDRGYELGSDNLVRPIRDDSQHVSANRNYADGGTVEMETEGYIMPAAAVKALGREFFDKLVSEHGGEPTTYNAGGAVRYADGGIVDDGSYTSVARGGSPGAGVYGAYGAGANRSGMYPGRALSRFAEGVRAGFMDKQQRELGDLQTQALRDDIAHRRSQREREARLQTIQGHRVIVWVKTEPESRFGSVFPGTKCL